MLFIALFNHLTPNRVRSEVLLLCVLNTDKLNPRFQSFCSYFPRYSSSAAYPPGQS